VVVEGQAKDQREPDGTRGTPKQRIPRPRTPRDKQPRDTKQGELDCLDAVAGRLRVIKDPLSWQGSCEDTPANAADSP
jgi:hypothetical protein